MEDYFRRRAGQAGLPRGFIDTYLEGVVYPEQYADLVRLGVAAIVLISWAGAWLRWRGTPPAGNARLGQAPARAQAAH